MPYTLHTRLCTKWIFWPRGTAVISQTRKIRSAIKTLFDELDKHVPVICTLAEIMEHLHDL